MRKPASPGEPALRAPGWAPGTPAARERGLQSLGLRVEQDLGPEGLTVWGAGRPDTAQLWGPSQGPSHTWRSRCPGGGRGRGSGPPETLLFVPRQEPARPASVWEETCARLGRRWVSGRRRRVHWVRTVGAGRVCTTVLLCTGPSASDPHTLPSPHIPNTGLPALHRTGLCPGCAGGPRSCQSLRTIFQVTQPGQRLPCVPGQKQAPWPPAQVRVQRGGGCAHSHP